jgi:hypothetical protein
MEGISGVDRDEFIRLINLTSATGADKHSAQNLIQKYIDPTAQYCMNCPPSVGAMFRRLKGWWSEIGKDKI